MSFKKTAYDSYKWLCSSQVPVWQKLVSIASAIVFFFILFKFDSSAVATMTGALIGALAIFLGNDINNEQIALKKMQSLEDTQRSIRSILMSELVVIFTSHVQKACEYYELVKILENGDGARPYVLSYQIPEPKIYNSFLIEVVRLPLKEVDALVTLYSQIHKTQDVINDYASLKPTEIGLFGARSVRDQFQADCNAAAEVVSLLAPERKIKLRDGSLILFVDLLKNPSRFR